MTPRFRLVVGGAGQWAARLYRADGTEIKGVLETGTRSMTEEVQTMHGLEQGQAPRTIILGVIVCISGMDDGIAWRLETDASDVEIVTDDT